MSVLGMSEEVIGLVSFMAYEDGHAGGRREMLGCLQKYMDLAINCFLDGRAK